MTLQEAYKQLLSKLYDLYNDREAANIADLVMEHVTGQCHIDRIMNKQMPVGITAQQQLYDYARQLQLHTPVQYVLHEAWFAGLKFYVDENVLIPRPETEELVEWIGDCRLQIADFKAKNEKDLQVSAGSKTQSSATSNRQLVIGIQSPVTSNLQPVTLLDIGTGSGCIPIALKKKFANWDVHALDVSVGALVVAQKNADSLQASIMFYAVDILNEEAWLTLPILDIIVSNPPYIKQSEEADMLDNVTNFEPNTALFVPDNDALLFYKKIADFALIHLHPNGLLFFEINEALGKEVCSMLAAKGFTDMELKKDMQGKDRMVKARCVYNT